MTPILTRTFVTIMWSMGVYNIIHHTVLLMLHIAEEKVALLRSMTHCFRVLDFLHSMQWWYCGSEPHLTILSYAIGTSSTLSSLDITRIEITPKLDKNISKTLYLFSLFYSPKKTLFKTFQFLLLIFTFRCSLMTIFSFFIFFHLNGVTR